jgi:hypothetical protein
MNKNGKPATTTTVPEPESRFKRATFQERHKQKMLDQAEKENVSVQYVFTKWIEEGEKMYDKKYPSSGAQAAT